jgi:hypothetical protein
VIRRVVSSIFFVLGGWMLMSEMMTAFLDVEAGPADNLGMIGVSLVVAAPLLLIGAWASPGRRWQELGLTILIAVVAALFCGLSVLVVFSDPGFKPFMPPMPKIELTPVVGTLNLLVVSAAGFALWRRGGQQRPEPDLERVFGDE